MMSTPPLLVRGAGAASPADAGANGALTLAEVERRHIVAALERTAWHQGRAASQLGISVKTLYRKIRAFGLQRPGGRRR